MEPAEIGEGSIHFYAYFEVRHPKLEFKWQYRPLVNSFTFFL